MAQEWVSIKHPSHGPDGGVGRVTREAFDEVLAIEGWQIVDPVAVKATEVLGRPVSDLKSLKKEELTTLAARTGVAVEEGAKVSDIVDTLNNTLGDNSAEEVAE